MSPLRHPTFSAWAQPQAPAPHTHPLPYLYNQMGFIHREGYPTLALVFAVSAALIFGADYLLPNNPIAMGLALAVSLFLVVTAGQFFRNPRRNTPLNNRHVIAPADGKVVVIEETEELEHVGGRCIQVSIFMSPINVHVNRNPISGVVDYFKYHPGKYLVAWHPKSSTENERTSLGIRNSAGQLVFLRQIAGALARRIVCYARPGDNVQQGSEFGFIKFGSRVDLYLPLGSQVLVKLDDKPIGGQTVIAELPIIKD